MFVRKSKVFLLLWACIIALSAPAMEQREEEQLDPSGQSVNTLVGNSTPLKDPELVNLITKHRPSLYRLPTEEENNFLTLVASQYLETAREKTSHPILKNIKEQKLQWLDCILKLGNNPPLLYTYNLSGELQKRKIDPQETYHANTIESLIKLEIETEYLKNLLENFEKLSEYDGGDFGMCEDIDDESIGQQCIMSPKAECYFLVFGKIKENKNIIEGIGNHLKTIGKLRSGEK